MAREFIVVLLTFDTSYGLEASEVLPLGLLLPLAITKAKIENTYNLITPSPKITQLIPTRDKMAASATVQRQVANSEVGSQACCGTY